MSTSLRLAITILLLSCVVQAQVLSPAASALRAKVQQIKPQSKISVIPLAGAEEFGTLFSAEEDDFTFYDVDTKVTRKLQYAEVKKVKRGYGGYNFVTHRHVDQTTSWIVTVGFIAGLLVLAVEAVRS